MSAATDSSTARRGSWERAVRVAPTIVDLAERRSARLLASALIVLTGLFLLVDTTLLLTRPGYVPPWYGYLFLGATFALNRAGRHRVAASLVVAMFPIVVFAQIATGLDARLPLAFLPLGLLVAMIFLPSRGVLVLAVLNMAVIVVARFLTHGRLALEQLLPPMAVNAIAAALVVGYGRHRAAIEADRGRALQANEERLRLAEEQLRQAQKMEALGRFAGGVAHDFNNLLTVIVGNLDMLGRRAPAKELDAARDAAMSAAWLTRQLLAFGRRAVLEPRVVSLNNTVRGTTDMIRRVIGEDIRVEMRLAADAWPTRVDERQVQQALLNLATNARDAMPGGGQLVLATENTTLSADEVRALAGDRDVPEREFVRLTVTDTGTGMDEATKSRIFEPFFTTKAANHGTGLGLPTVFGVVTQSGGLVEVQSQPAAGATFHLYLPRSLDPVDTPPQPVGARSGGGETILVVEDEDLVRPVLTATLAERGFRVLAAENADAALHLWRAHGETIALLLTDVVMPGMSGPQLARRLRDERPSLPVLFMTGYAPDDAVHGDALREEEVLAKPFLPDALAAKVRKVLDRAAAARA